MLPTVKRGKKQKSRIFMTFCGFSQNRSVFYGFLIATKFEFSLVITFMAFYDRVRTLSIPPATSKPIFTKNLNHFQKKKKYANNGGHFKIVRKLHLFSMMKVILA